MVNLSLYNRFWGHLAQKLIKIKFLDSGIHYSPIFADKVSKEAGTAGRQKSSYFSDIKHFGFMFLTQSVSLYGMGPPNRLFSIPAKRWR